MGQDCDFYDGDYENGGKETHRYRPGVVRSERTTMDASNDGSKEIQSIFDEKSVISLTQ